jgi:gliding motility-associated-like protein
MQDRVVFITNEIDYEDNEESLKAKNRGDDNLAVKLAAVTTQHRFDLYFENAETNVDIQGEANTKIKNDFYLPHCPDGLLNVPSFNKVKYNNIYPNIDMVFYQDESVLKYEFIVHPGGNPSLIEMNWQGVEKLYMNGKNQVEFNVGSFTFTDKAPISFSGKEVVETAYVVEGNNIKFDVANYNEQQKLILDPGLFWASSLEYNGYGSWGEMVANSVGEYYVVDWEWSPDATDVADYLSSAGSTITYGTVTGNNDIVISKFGPNGALLWACLYGGSGDDDVNGAVGIDHDDNLFISGTSRKEFSMGSGDFPLQNWAGAFYQGWDATQSIGTRGYILKFLPDNTRQWATYLDKGANLETFDIDFDAGKNTYLVGKSGGYPTYSTGIPSGSGYQGNLSGTSTATSFIIEFSTTGALIWATWLPGVAADTYTGRACDIAINQNTGEFYIAGDEMWSSTTRFVSALITDTYTNQGANDLFYMKFDASNQPDPSWGGYIGGAGFDKINIGAANGDTELDSDGNMYMTGHTYSANFPVVDPGDACTYYDGIINDGTGITANEASTQDGYLFKVNTSGTIVYATFFGGADYTSMKKLKKDSHDNLWICGHQSPTGLSTISHAEYYNQTMAGTSSNILLAQLLDNDYLAWLSYYGFSGGYSGYNGFDIGEPTTDSVYLYLTGKFSGLTNVGGGYQYVNGGSCTGAAVFHHYLNAEGPISATANPTGVCSGTPTNITLTASGGSPASGDVYWYTGSCGGTFIGTGNPLNISQTLSASETYYVNYNNGCITSVCESATVTVNPNPTANAGSNSPLCEGEDLLLTETGGGATSWSWSGPNGFTSSANNPSITGVTATASGTYTVTVTNAGGCSNTDDVLVSVNTLPSIPVTNVDCSGGDGNGIINITSPTGPDYEYSIGGSFQSSTSFGSLSNGTYYVTVSNTTTGCTVESALVDVNCGCSNPPSVTLNSTTGNTCGVNSVTLSGNTFGGSATEVNLTHGGNGSLNATNFNTSPFSFTYTPVAADAGTTVSITVTTNNPLGVPCTLSQETYTLTVNPIPGATAGSNSAVCVGETLNLTESGGDANSWSWSGPGSYSSIIQNPIISPVTLSDAGLYTVIVTDINGCTTSDDVSVVVNAIPDATITDPGDFCSDDAAANLTAATTGGIWSGTGITDVSAGTFDPSAANTGINTITYELTMSGCTGTDNIDIEVFETPDATITAQADMCSSDAIIFLSAADAGGTWSGAGIVDASTGSFDSSLAGSGDITISYDIGSGSCLDSDTETFHVYAAVNADITPAGPFCGSDSPVILSATDSGGTWSGTGITDVTTGAFDPGALTPGNYLITYDIVNGECADTDTETISVQNAPDPTITSGTDFCVNESSVFLTAVSAGGTWSGIGITDPATGEFDPAVAGVGVHTITYENSTGSCVDNDQVDIEVHAEPNISILDAAEPLCYGGSDGSIQVSSSADSPVFTWPDLTTGDSYTNLSAGTYIANVQDAYGCTSTQSIILGEPDQLTVSFSDVQQLSCNGNNDGSLSATASGGTISGDYTWLWNTGDNVPNINNLAAGTYTLTVSDDNSCQVIISETLSEPATVVLTGSASDVLCLSAQAGNCSVSVSGGSGPYTYQWDGLPDTSASVSNLSAGNYTVSVEDVNGCSAETSMTINAVGNLNVSINVVSDIACAGDANGELIAQHNGQAPFSYLWSPGAYTTQAINSLPAGNYQVEVIDELGCAGSASAELISPPAITAIATVDSISCYGSNDGAISLNISGGHSPFVVNWSNGNTGNLISNLNGGWYSYTITDNQNCQFIDSVYVYEPITALYLNLHKTNISCYGYEDGSASANVSGGTPPYYFQWYYNGSVISNDSVANGLAEGIYQLHISDSRGCATDTSLTIQQPSEILLSYISGNPSCIGNTDGYISLQVVGGTSPYMAVIDGVPIPFLEISNLQEGNYNIAVQDANACQYELNTITLVDNPVDCIRIPNAFTPNADDNNDTWIIENLDLFDNYIVYVFNRWGQKLYQARPGDKAWDGTTNTGKLVPTGSYIYVVNLHNGNDPYTGIVTVVY